MPELKVCPYCESEKQARIGYQDIVYAVCNKLDQILKNRPGQGILATKHEMLRALETVLNQRKLSDVEHEKQTHIE